MPLFLQEPVIELDSNAAIRWDLTQPGESQWNELGKADVTLKLSHKKFTVSFVKSKHLWALVMFFLLKLLQDAVQKKQILMH